MAGGHRQGHRRLHEEENHLHIEPKSGGGKNVTSMWVDSVITSPGVHPY